MSNDTAKATEKAWLLVKDILEDEDKYLDLRAGNYIILRGSNGKDYVIYPNGSVAILKKSGIQQGKISGSDFVEPDYLATLIAWIRFSADELERSWGCGSLSLQKPRPEPQETDEVTEWVQRRYEPSIYDRIPIDGIIKAVMFLVPMAVMLPLFMSVMDDMTNNTSMFVNSSIADSGIMPIATFLLPLLFIFGMALQVMKRL